MQRQTNGPGALSCEGRYRIVGQLGVGGMGIVYLASDLRLDREVAVKVVRKDRADGPGAFRQLEREAAAMVRANGPHVCSVYDLTEWDGRPCLVIERLVGDTLEARIASGRVETMELLDIAEQLAEALEAVHRVGLIHQDIKPSNVFVTTTGLIKLLDFGLAEACGVAPNDTAFGHRSARHSVLGTANYIAPERILRRPVDHRSDLFSLGAVIYEMTTGRQPFAGASSAEALFNVLDSTPPPIRTVTSGRPVAIGRLVRKLLEKSPERRYRSAAGVRRDLADMRTGESMPRPRKNAQRRFTIGGINDAAKNRDHARL
jgi:serine/threonine protein kinase